ncbi:MAG: malonyl-ACP O-methyltransferase BioC [Betaproteobacteria bacterium]|nr:malonyl-ACP O-methyltransferase BioC [Betaproteobacteria bacterium]MDH3437903.1 malonyl-ACP O-methyltransferase BioC [Betaproteobacteria bacterium]
MSAEFTVDKHQVRRSFERAAETYDAGSVLQNEICQRMLARLDYIKLEPDWVVDAGSGTGNAVPGLLTRFPRARVVAIDLALAMVRRAHLRRARWRRLLDWRGARVAAVCADIEQLPVASGAAGLIWSNLTLQWVNEPQQAFAEMQRALAPGGLLMFSSFGPDTLKELRAAFQGADSHTHVNRFIDMHNIGDALIAQGFADPVMDMEYVTLTYADVRDLMRDLKSIGAHNVTYGRPAALSGKSLLTKVAQGYETFRQNGKLPATFEVVYGHAWKPQARLSPTGRPVIDIKPRAR